MAAKLAVVLVAILVISRPSVAEWHGEARPMMGTEVSVYLWHVDAGAGSAAVNTVFDEVGRIDRLMSTYRDDSRISLINREAAAKPVDAGSELYRLIERSLDISVLTLGAFDITYDSVGQHYDFRKGVRPSQPDIVAGLDSIDYRLVELGRDGHSVRFLADGVRINLGGIAKGYAVERAAYLLQQRGVEHAIVTAGGDSRLVGDRHGQPWMIGVQDPRDDGKVAIRLPLEDEAISTSGDYERFFDEGGIRYHHIIRPETGEPAQGVHSATIVGPDAIMTDALSTSVFIMGVDKGLTLISTLPDYEGIVIDADGELYYSDGLVPPEQLD
ncbi:MAG: FAD:protein FMN transferase [Gammaproteobacteria bacterium]|nr:FAD:protein FMN transferase [Gammaproteobacteria bacterium]